MDLLSQDSPLIFARMAEILIKIVNKSSNQIPDYATEGAAGMDLRANLGEPVVILPLKRSLIPTGLFLEIPAGFEGQVRPRSGLALNYGVTCLNSPGTVDSDFRGELKVILVNISDEPVTVKHGERIAQLVLSKVERAAWEVAEELTTSTRGEGGFGHTGK